MRSFDAIKRHFQRLELKKFSEKVTKNALLTK